MYECNVFSGMICYVITFLCYVRLKFMFSGIFRTGKTCFIFTCKAYVRCFLKTLKNYEKYFLFHLKSILNIFKCLYFCPPFFFLPVDHCFRGSLKNIFMEKSCRRYAPKATMALPCWDSTSLLGQFHSPPLGKPHSQGADPVQL